MNRSEINVEPVHDEFFKSQDLADALVRESIQNSLDARRGRASVRVHFRLIDGASAIPRERLDPWFEGLDRHLAAVAAEMPGNWPSTDAPVSLLLVEDYGTRGLAGDPGSDPELEPDASEKNDFFFFWRNVGRSKKGEQDRGRWGLGKAVFPISSNIRTIFGLTHRSSDDRRLLLGQSVLRTHILDGQRIYPYGFFADHARDGFPHPVDDAKTIARFVRDFGADRDEPGLSLVVPWFRGKDDELTVERLVKAVVEQYFYPIVRGDLQVSVERDARKEVISARTIDAVAESLDHGEEFRRLCALTRWSVGPQEFTRTAAIPETTAPSWNSRTGAWQPFTASQVDTLRERLESGNRVAIEVQVPIKRKKRVSQSTFHVFLEKDDDLARGDHTFIRRGITIPDIPRTARYSRDKPVRALLVVSDDALSTLLGDAENPAHSDWSERADKVRELYDHGAYTVRFVKNAISQLAAILLRPSEGRSKDLLRDVFFVDASDQEIPEKDLEDAAHGGDSEEGFTAIPDVIARPSAGFAKITERSDGLSIRGSGDPSVVGRPIEVRLAYRSRVGNPFLRYAKSDFDLARDVKQKFKGVRVDSAQQNVLRFVPTNAEYSVILGGFDPHRDLVVRVEAAEADAQED